MTQGSGNHYRSDYSSNWVFFTVDAIAAEWDLSLFFFFFSVCIHQGGGGIECEARQKAKQEKAGLSREVRVAAGCPGSLVGEGEGRRGEGEGRGRLGGVIQKLAAPTGGQAPWTPGVTLRAGELDVCWRGAAETNTTPALTDTHYMPTLG